MLFSLPSHGDSFKQEQTSHLNGLFWEHAGRWRRWNSYTLSQDFRAGLSIIVIHYALVTTPNSGDIS